MSTEGVGPTPKFRIQHSQQKAFQIVAEQMRRNYGRFSEEELFLQACVALKETAPNWTENDRQQAAGHISRSIFKNFDPSKSRSPPKESRGEKARRNREILNYVYSIKPRVSAATVANKFGISKTTAHGIMKRAGYYSPNLTQVNSVSKLAFAALCLFEEQFPFDGYRLVKLEAVANAISLMDFDEAEVFAEINSASQPLQLRLLDKPVLNGKPIWLVVERGRRKSAHFLVIWGLRQVSRMARDPRLRMDQHVILNLSDRLTPKHPILRDIAAVINVSRGSECLNTWRRFLDASTNVVGGQDFITLEDSEALINALNGAIRRNNLEARISSISEWLPNAADRLGARRLLSIAICLRKERFSYPLEPFHLWAERTDYRKRIKQGLLPGRKICDYEKIGLYESISDTDELLRAFWRNPSDRIWLDTFDEQLDEEI